MGSSVNSNIANFAAKSTNQVNYSSLEFADETKVREIVKKYSSFVGSSIALNGTKSNDLRPGEKLKTAKSLCLVFLLFESIKQNYK